MSDDEVFAGIARQIIRLGNGLGFEPPAAKDLASIVEYAGDVRRAILTLDDRPRWRKEDHIQGLKFLIMRAEGAWIRGQQDNGPAP